MIPTARIEVRLNELSQLFNSMDPSPFFEKDLDSNAEDFIVGWARELPSDRPLEIVISVQRAPAAVQDSTTVQRGVTEALHHYFEHKAEHARREFSELMRIGRWSLMVGLLFLTACLFTSRLFDSNEPATFLIRESLVIAGWVAMWRPIEIFLYDWWPIRRRIRLFRRLAEASVAVRIAT